MKKTARHILLLAAIGIVVVCGPVAKAQTRASVAEQTAEEPLRYTFSINFPFNKSVVYSSFRKNEQQLQAMRLFLDSVNDNPRLQMLAADVYGYVSPEGDSLVNIRLMRARADAYKRTIQQSALPALPDSLFSVYSTPLPSIREERFVRLNADERAATFAMLRRASVIFTIGKNKACAEVEEITPPPTTIPNNCKSIS